MAVWELIQEVLTGAHAGGRTWLTRGEIVNAVVAKDPIANKGTIAAHVSAMCINDPSKDQYSGRRYRNNPLLVTDDPTMRGKRFRLLSPAERGAYLVEQRDDLQFVSYANLLEWLKNSSVPLEAQATDEEIEQAAQSDEIVFSGAALLELHLQDYLHRNWSAVFPSLSIYNGGHGREFRTADPGVGIIDFLCTDADGNFVVVETKRNEPDRQAIGQVMGYMGWVQSRLCAEGQSVRGILVASEATDRLRMAVAATPNLEIYLYEISFQIKPDAPGA